MSLIHTADSRSVFEDMINMMKISNVYYMVRFILPFTLIVVLSVLFVLTLITSGLLQAADLELNTAHNPPLANEARNGFHDRVAIEAYKRLGMEIDIQRVPSARSGINVNQGIDDGNGPRIDGYTKFFPNLLMVPEKVIDFDFVGFTRDPAINPLGWQGLADLNVGIVTGWKILEVKITESQSLTKVRDTEQLFRMLARDRVDIVIIERWTGLYAAKQAGITDLHVVEPPFATKPMYFHLHKKHTDLAEKVAAAIREIKADGTYDRLLKETLLPLVPQ